MKIYTLSYIVWLRLYKWDGITCIIDRYSLGEKKYVKNWEKSDASRVHT